MIVTGNITPLFGKTLEQQLADERRWAEERDWGLPASAFDNVDTTPSGVAKGLVVDVIYSILPDKGKGGGKIKSVQRTFEEGWEIGSNLFPHHWRFGALSNPKHLRLLRGIEYKPGVYRATIDLGAHWDQGGGIRPVDVRSTDSAGPEVLAAVRHFTEWVAAMDGERVPYVLLSAYRASLVGGRPWVYLPNLYWRGSVQALELSVCWEAGACFDRTAMPRVVSRS